MILKEEKRKKVKVWNNIIVSQVVYGCDECRKEMDLNNPDVDYLRSTIHKNNSGYQELTFCSWKCVLKYLPKIKCDYFVSLPYVMYDNNKKGCTAKDLIKLLSHAPTK